MAIGDRAAECSAEEGVGEIVHAYTMRDDLAGRPGQP
jgi:hypothetical protein